MSNFHTIFLDLDDTLYPSNNGLWEAIGDRILLYMTDRLAIPEEDVDPLRAKYLHTYGTTLAGLVKHHQANRHDYLSYVHDVPLHQYIQEDPDLGNMLTRLPQQRVIFTNASRGHVTGVLQLLGCEDQIDLILDIHTLDFHNKPSPEAYRRAVKAAGVEDASTCLLVDDRLENLYPGAQLGMTTVLVGDHDGTGKVDHCIRKITDLVRAIPALLEPER
ncbi:MAG: pyrimidine 5'-nucleotidase [Anaerolineales bacterium]|jgi:pyrimidine 5'-nucleotidase